MLISIAVGYFGYARIPPISNANYLLYDTYQQYSASGKPSSRAIVVDIDDASLEAVGQWPWLRYRVTGLIQAIAKMNPAAIGMDIIFAEPDRTTLINIQQAFKDDFDLDVKFAGVPPR
jgi:adenylate cyclase